MTAIKFARYKISKKKKKHDEIRGLAESKLNSIDNHVSKAIEDGSISQESIVDKEKRAYRKTFEIKINFIREKSFYDDDNIQRDTPPAYDLKF